MSDIFDQLSNLPIEPNPMFAETGKVPNIAGIPIRGGDTANFPTVGPTGTARIPITRTKGSATLGRRVLRTAKGTFVNAAKAALGGISGTAIGTLSAQYQVKDAVGIAGNLGKLSFGNPAYATQAAAELFDFAATRGGFIGAFAGATVGMLNPALRSVAAGTARSTARGARKVGRRVSGRLRRAPRSRSVTIDDAIRGDFLPIVEQTDSNIQSSIEDLVRQTGVIQQSRIDPLAGQSSGNISLGLGRSAVPSGPISISTMPIVSVAPTTGSTSGSVAAITSGSVPATSGTPLTTIPGAAASTSSTTSATATIASTTRTPAAVLPVTTPSRIPASRMSSGTKYGIFAGGLLATSMLMNAKTNRGNQKTQMNQYQTSPHPNSVRNQYVPA